MKKLIQILRESEVDDFDWVSGNGFETIIQQVLEDALNGTEYQVTEVDDNTIIITDDIGGLYFSINTDDIKSVGSLIKIANHEYEVCLEHNGISDTVTIEYKEILDAIINHINGVINESEDDDFDWVKDTESFEDDWMIINDVKDEDPHMIYSQKYLFSIGWAWNGGTTELYNDHNNSFHALSGEPHHENNGNTWFGFYTSGGSNNFRDTHKNATEIYYNSQFKEANINESEDDDFDWADKVQPDEEELMLHVGRKYQTPNGNVAEITKSENKMIDYTLYKLGKYNSVEHITDVDYLTFGMWVRRGVWKPYYGDINESEDDDFGWVRDIEVQIPITDLEPGDRYHITSINGDALTDYNNNFFLSDFDVYSTVFKLDDQENFYIKESDAGFVDSVSEMTNMKGNVWVRVEDDDGDWINVDAITVQRVDS